MISLKRFIAVVVSYVIGILLVKKWTYNIFYNLAENGMTMLSIYYLKFFVLSKNLARHINFQVS